MLFILSKYIPHLGPHTIKVILKTSPPSPWPPIKVYMCCELLAGTVVAVGVYMTVHGVCVHIYMLKRGVVQHNYLNFVCLFSRVCASIKHLCGGASWAHDRSGRLCPPFPLVFSLFGLLLHL